MKKKVLLLTAMCAMLAYMLCGCGEKVGAETLMTDSITHLKEATSTESGDYELPDNCVDSFENGSDTKEESNVDTETPSKDYSSVDDKR